MTDLKEIEALVNESGNSFHCRVVNFLRDKGWQTLVSPYYMDSATNKPREIDLIAEKSWIYKNQFEGKRGDVIFKLFIECKYIPQANVFWFSEKDVVSAKQWVITSTPLPENNMFTERHHYLATNPKVAKLFASKSRPNAENEVIYKALNQSLNAMVYLRGRQSINREYRERRIPILTTIEMPVILCNSFAGFYRVEMEESGEPRPIDTNFQLEVNYAYLDQQKNHRTEYFLIDIVDFGKLDTFLDVLDADKDAIFQIL
ncbi:MAG: hypothetical protein JRE23_16820 [Deltaproteobacteria bacterium]|nr:hypothetical protein [Deltaproteobacteria bacterium]